MITQPLRRVWRIGQPGEKSEPLFGRLQGSFESIYTLDERHAVSLDAHGRHEIDLSLPSAPVVKSTPLLGLQPAHLVLGTSSELVSFRAPTAPSASEFSLASVDRSGLALQGRVKLAGKRQALSGDEVLTLDFEAATNRFRIQTFPFAALREGQSEQSLQASGDIWLPGTAQPQGGFRGKMPAVIGADAQSLVVAERWEGVQSVYLHWLSRSAGKYTPDLAQELSLVGVGLPEQVLVRGDRALVVTKFNLLLIERTNHGLKVQTSSTQEGDAVALKWTKDFIYVALGSSLQGVPTSLELLSASDLSTAHSYPLDDQALGLAEVGSHLVVTTRHGFAVLTPPCMATMDTSR